MYLFVELWNVRQAWLDLSTDERQAYANGVGGAVGQLLEAGIEIIGWSKLDVAEYPSGYVYMAVYKMPSLAAVELFEKTVSEAGWYNYFEQINARGTLESPVDVLGQLVAL